MMESAIAQTGENCLLTAKPGHDCRVRRAFRGLLSYLLVFLFGFFAMLYFVSEPQTFSDGTSEIGVSGNDSFYHLKMSAMLTEHGLVHKFPWLKFSYFRQEGHDFVSHHYGFHVLLLPFVKVSEWLTGEPLAGGRWAVCAFFGFNVMLFFAILRTARVPWAWFWLLVWMLLPFQFFMRHGYVRAIGPSLMCMQLIVLLTMQKRFIWVGIVAAISNHVYLGAIMYTPVIIAAYAAACVIDRDGLSKFPWKIVLGAFVGWLIGAVTYPYFEGMIEFLKLQVLGTGLAPDIEVGREWKPYNGVWWFVTALAGPLLVMFTTSALLRFRLGPRLNADEMFVMLLNVGFLLLTLKARRFVEYWPAFALMSAALLARPVVDWWFGLSPKAIPAEGAADGQASEEPARSEGLIWLYLVLSGSCYVIVQGVWGLWKQREAWQLSEALPLALAGALLLLFVALFGAEPNRSGRRRIADGLPSRLIFGMAAILFVANLGMMTSWRAVRDGSKLRFDLPEVRTLMSYLKAESKPGDVVFTTDWDDFPLFFYHNAYNHFVVGLDPKFTHERRPVLWERYVKLTRGLTPTRVSVERHDDEGRPFTDNVKVELADIRNHFLAKYVITDRDHKKLAAQLNRDKKLAELVFPCRMYSECSDSPYLVFRIIDPVSSTSQPAE